MRVVLLTWREWAARTALEWIASRDHELVLVLTSQGRPDIRLDGWKQVLALLPPEVPAVLSSRSGDFADVVDQVEPDIVLSMAYPHLIDDRIIGAARVAALNVHPGRLPDYRGANPFWAIYREEDEFTITVHRLAHGFDIGAVMATRVLPVGEAPTAEGLFDAMLEAIPLVLDAAVDRAGTGDPGEVQAPGAYPEWHLFAEADGQLDWDASVRSLLCRHAACRMSGTQTTMQVGPQVRRIRHMRPVVDVATAHQPGTVLSMLGDDAIVAARDGLIMVECEPV